MTQPSTALVPTTGLTDPNDPSLQAKLFRDLFLLSEQVKGTKMLFNIQLAALHLACMLKTGQEGPELDLVRLFKSFWLCNLSLA